MRQPFGSSIRPTLEGSPLGSPQNVASASRSVREMFESVAPRYDFLNHFLSAGMDIAWRRAAARALREALGTTGSTALDVCCGTGDLALELQRVSRGRVIGADFCQPMLRRAERKLARRTSRRWRDITSFMGADALSLPFRDQTFDVIASAFGFRNLANYELGLCEMRRVLKPGGVIAILEFSRVRWPIFGRLFGLYFAHVLPLLGTWLSGVRGPYQYLHDSVSGFPDQETLAARMRTAGFSDVSFRNLMGGVAALHTGQKCRIDSEASRPELAFYPAGN
ncbi:MAG: bifunctional demethylmenaquinone methyltransferase/2-methoxy-6-polyprenyl-1,4-benzoquinol methylase UbiE [Terriglobia bacterium]